jgi:hypothetical protein
LALAQRSAAGAIERVPAALSHLGDSVAQANARVHAGRADERPCAASVGAHQASTYLTTRPGRDGAPADFVSTIS